MVSVLVVRWSSDVVCPSLAGDVPVVVVVMVCAFE
jgi:hypothetical protein